MCSQVSFVQNFGGEFPENWTLKGPLEEAVTVCF